MILSELLAKHTFKNGDSILKDGTTSEDVEKALSGLNDELKGLSEQETVKLFEDNTFFKSYVDKRTADGITTREGKLSKEFNVEKADLNKQIKELQSSNNKLKASVPMSGDPEELRKRALDEPDPVKRDMLNMKADNIETKNELAERKANDEKKDVELLREKLVNVARTEIGEKKLPKFISENLHHYVGADEETTKGKIANFIKDLDDFSKDILTAGLNDDTPPAAQELERDPEEVMKEKMSKLDF